MVYIGDYILTLNNFVRWSVEKEYIDLAVRYGFNNYNILLYEYAKKGDSDMVNYYLKLTDNNYTMAAAGAIEGNHKKLFDYIYHINHKLQISYLLYAAYKSDNQELVSYIISLFPIINTANFKWDSILYVALLQEDFEGFNYLH